MKRFKSPRQCQRFVAIHGPIANLFNLPRNLLTSAQYRELRNSSMEAWSRITTSTAA
jgi:transposase-like protein